MGTPGLAAAMWPAALGDGIRGWLGRITPAKQSMIGIAFVAFT